MSLVINAIQVTPGNTTTVTQWSQARLPLLRQLSPHGDDEGIIVLYPHVCYGPSRLGATHGRQAPHHPSGQQARVLQTGIQWLTR